MWLPPSMEHDMFKTKLSCLSARLFQMDPSHFIVTSHFMVSFSFPYYLFIPSSLPLPSLPCSDSQIIMHRYSCSLELQILLEILDFLGDMLDVKLDVENLSRKEFFNI